MRAITVLAATASLGLVAANPLPLTSAVDAKPAGAVSPRALIPRSSDTDLHTPPATDGPTPAFKLKGPTPVPASVPPLTEVSWAPHLQPDLGKLSAGARNGWPWTGCHATHNLGCKKAEITSFPRLDGNRQFVTVDTDSGKNWRVYSNNEVKDHTGATISGYFADGPPKPGDAAHRHWRAKFDRFRAKHDGAAAAAAPHTTEFSFEPKVMMAGRG